MADKSLGQHWLNDQPALSSIIEVSNLNKDDFVLEVGPGQGSLTKLLSEKAGKVLSIEIDHQLIQELENKFSGTNVEIREGDILKFDLNSLPKGYKIVANLPYYLTSHFIQIISESTNPPNQATLLIQKEVAERLSAKPGSMSILSVTCQYFWEVSPGDIVPSHLFTPPPKVDSQIVLLNRKEHLLLDSSENSTYFKLVKAGFSKKRKTLQNSLSSSLHLSKEQSLNLLNQAGIDPKRRAQTLSLEEWLKMYQAYKA
ncbi:MAG TPA: 16S rRNA (adenine(1518)-N(6)/adenine(1519)-N(6))-dimethyltransferase RsmA [Candidatus Sulfotelmatobacter sp.]|nr:16S rRNA (adenine(1518)-N(6)/adenine(1519)-N(6))-dimethyltransferase RsmA [Candidatus Sulfotelmatobacter sp.]